MRKCLLSLSALLMIATGAQADGIRPAMDMKVVAARAADRPRRSILVLPAMAAPQHSADADGAMGTVEEHPPTPPTDLAAVYDHITREIHLVWSQAGDVTVNYWRIYYALRPGGPYEELGRADNDGRTQQAFSAPLSVVPAGDTAPVYFVVVSFRSEDIFSPLSREASVLIDRSQEPPVKDPLIMACVRLEAAQF